MNEELKCPQCGGNQFKNLGDTYKCLYCGTMFQPIVESPKQEQPIQSTPTVSQIPTTPSSNVNVTVSVPNAGGYDNRRNDNSFSKGAALGVGVAAGGCLTTTAIILAIPFLLFLALLSMCSSSM